MNQYDVQPLDLMQLINEKYHEPFIHEKIKLDGKLDTDRFIKAVDTLMNAYPLIKCYYDHKQNAFIENEGSKADDLVVIAESADDKALLESLNANQKLIQFTLAGNFLYITVSHMICDGSGFKQLIYTLCDIYNDAFDGGSYLMNRDFSLLTKNIGGSAGMTAKMLISMAGNYKNHPIYERSDTSKGFIIEKTIPKDTMKKIHSLAKAQGATLNDVFLTAYARAISRHCGLEKVNVPCTVDLRKYSSDKMGAANMTGSYNLNIKIGKSDSFGQTLSDVTANMQKQKKTKNDIAGPMLLVSKYKKSSLDDFLKLYGGMDTSAFTDYTNLGILDDKRLTFNGAQVINAVGYSGVSKAPNFQIAVSSFKGITTISSLFCCGENEKIKAEQIVNQVISELIIFSGAEQE